MNTKKLLSIITIICFCSVILIPVGIALMWLQTGWKIKIKAILSTVLGLLYVGIVIFLLLLEPSVNTSGVSLPFSYSEGATEFQTENNFGKEQKNTLTEDESKNKTSKDTPDEKQSEEQTLPRKITHKKGERVGRWFYTILFLLIILLLIIIQNRRFKNKDIFENPYVDTNQYKLPLSPDSKMPMVHFLNLRLKDKERIYFATPTNQKDNAGNFVVTSQRVIIKNLKENVEFGYTELTAVSSISNSVIQLTAGSRKYYIFMDESQVKYALAVVRWAFSKATAV